MIYGCFVVLIACSSASEKKVEAKSLDLTVPASQNIADQPKADASTSLPDTNEISDDLTSEEKEPVNSINAQGASTDNQPDLTSTIKVTPSQPAPVPTAKTTTPTATSTTEAEAKPVPVQTNTIIISVVPDMMKFSKEVFTVIAGQKVTIELENQDGMQHNMVISKPNTIKIVGAAADVLARDPKGAQKNYVPDIPEVLYATKLLNPEEVVTLTFTAPAEPGDYPFVCTFPGHWRMMNGIMKVTK